MYEGLLGETIRYTAHNGDEIPAYFARPLGVVNVPGVVVLHHMPGWDDATKEITRKFAHYGYAAIMPHLHYREGGDASPDDAAAATRAAGGVPDDRCVGDVEAAMQYLRALPYANGKVGIIGFCSGGRQVYLCAGRIPSLDAAVDCWGGRVVVGSPADLTERQPVAPIDYTPNIKAPLMGIFGNDDQSPSPADVDRIEAELKRNNKVYEFHRYDGAGHGFFAVDRPGYRPVQATDAWQHVLRWYETYLKTGAPTREPVAAGRS
jgi:carboxymethylenebutenolidase